MQQTGWCKSVAAIRQQFQIRMYQGSEILVAFERFTCLGKCTAGCENCRFHVLVRFKDFRHVHDSRAIGSRNDQRHFAFVNFGPKLCPRISAAAESSSTKSTGSSAAATTAAAGRRAFQSSAKLIETG